MIKRKDIQLKNFFSQEEVQKLQTAFNEVVEKKRSRFLNKEDHWHEHEDKDSYEKVSTCLSLTKKKNIYFLLVSRYSNN